MSVTISFFLLHFRFWGTCEEHARLLHRYTPGSVICCLSPHHLYLAFLPMLSLSNSRPPAVHPHFPPTDPSVWCYLPCVHEFSLFNTHLSVRTCSVFLFLCQFAENGGFQVHPCPYKKHELIIFDGCITFDGVYVPHLRGYMWGCTCHIFPVQSIIDGHLGWFQVFAVVNWAAMNIPVHVSL